ncbi:ABC transporter ATP-binding protein [Bacteroidia bacterium]|nr:ABC transporter ATP-binding protein [Bacteroidia bacterium]GHV71856.1 ABC transporter ATP-binding protein [Bacteroidia bacterium]
MSKEKTNILSIQDLSGGYTKEHDILQGVNLDVEQGQAVGIIGLNGSGKSTLAKCLMNTVPYRNGKILFDGKNISRYSTKQLSDVGIALFLQGGRVFDELTVEENLKLFGNFDKTLNWLTPNVVSQFSIFNFPKLRADKLSGGQRHQLALAMCLLKKPNPKLLILDEPSAGLSPIAVEETYNILECLRDDNELTIILIEQNIARAIAFCDSINMLQNGKFVYSSDKKDIKEVESIMFKE